MVQIPSLYPYKLKRLLYWYRTSLLLLLFLVLLPFLQNNVVLGSFLARVGREADGGLNCRVSQLQALLLRNALGICYEEERPIHPTRFNPPPEEISRTNEKMPYVQLN